MYDDLAWVWSIICSPEEQVEETELFTKTLREHTKIPIENILCLGCGAGGSDFTFKKYFNVTGLDLSESMLNLAKNLNPEVIYHLGDMRDVRLEQKFDAVTVLDSIVYNLTEEDIRSTYKMAYEHLEPGGVFLTYIDYTSENFIQNQTLVNAWRNDDVEITLVENYFDPNTNDAQFEATFIFLIRKSGKLEVQTDHHVMGLFKTEIWVNLLKETGFKVKLLKFEHASFESGKSLPMLVGIKPL